MSPRRLLAVSGVPPWPTRGGFSLRPAHLLRELAKDWDITLIAPTGQPDETTSGSAPANIALVPVDLSPPWLPVPAAAARRRLREIAGQVLARQRPDVALLWLGTEFLALERADFPPCVADRVDCAALDRWRAARRSPGTLLRALRYAWYERRMVRRVGATVVVGDDDARALKRIGGSAKIVVIPNGVAFQASPRFELEHQAPTIGFSGTLDHYPNIDAARYFIGAIWPAIRQRVPNARFVIAGRAPSHKVMALQAVDGVEVWPDVPNMTELLQTCWVTVAPMRIGTGIKNKVLEGWAAGRPVVMTPLATNGLELDGTLDQTVRETPEAFAALVIELLENRERRHQLGLAGYTLARGRYTWGRAADRMSEVLRSVAAGH